LAYKLILKRFFDFLLAAILLLFFILPGIFLWAAIRVTSDGSAIYWSDRVGKDNIIFKMPKFRTMKKNTPPVATHLLINPKAYLTPIGSFLRRTSLDEIPQIISILRGQMSFVGPRPALFNQKELIAMRSKAGVEKLLPGLTGWAQVNGRDELNLQQKVALDVEYVRMQSLLFDIQILWMTFLKVIRRDGVKH
jgi:O-antigen biosynthesis protein WbqP